MFFSFYSRVKIWLSRFFPFHSPMSVQEPEKDWANERGIATEPNIDRFILKAGGERVDKRFPNADFENADYVFDEDRVIIELKIIETEFGETKSFLDKEQEILKEMAGKFSFGEIIRLEAGPNEFYSKKKLELYRAPLSRIAKKANNQIKKTKLALGDNSYRGVLWLVNDNFRQIGSDLVFSIMCRILNGSNSNIKALIYVTNHYVDIGNGYANLLWVPSYADHESDNLPDFINWLGTEWFDFMEAETGTFEHREKGPDITIAGARPILHSPSDDQ